MNATPSAMALASDASIPLKTAGLHPKAVTVFRGGLRALLAVFSGHLAAFDAAVMRLAEMKHVVSKGARFQERTHPRLVKARRPETHCRVNALGGRCSSAQEEPAYPLAKLTYLTPSRTQRHATPLALLDVRHCDCFGSP
jgi:hypothetical protein